MNKFCEGIKNNIFLLRTFCRNGGLLHISVMFFLKVMNAAFNIWFSIFFPAIITKSLLEEKSFFHIFSIIFVTVLGVVIMSLLGALYNKYIGNLAEQKVLKKIKLNFYKKALEIDLINYQNSDFYDSYQRALSEINKRFIKAINDYVNFISCILSLVVSILVLNSIEWKLIVFIIIPLIVNLIISIKVKKYNYQYEISNTNTKRRIQYCTRIAYLPEYAKENRINEIYKYLLIKHEENMKIFVDNKIKQTKHVNTLDFINSNINFLFITVIPAIYAVYKITYCNMEITALIILLGSILSIYNNLNSIFAFFPELNENDLFIQNYQKFMEYESEIKSGEVIADRNFELIEIKNVKFSYDGNNPAIKNINMSIRNREKIAIVGPNGAGKTTFVKLLMRLYEPDYGDIKYNGINIKNYTLDSYYRLFGTVFQDFNQYAFTVKENMYFGNADKEPDEIVEEILSKVGLINKVRRHPKGISAEVGNEFSDGINFSGGESQKLAISRAVAKDCPIIILDEASSALDPVSEREMNKMMLDAFKDKAIIIISHRLSTVINVDKIYYFDNGEIVEQGTHSELLSNRGRYYGMFSAQVEQYGLKLS